jgi:hypothetical protein
MTTRQWSRALPARHIFSTIKLWRTMGCGSLDHRPPIPLEPPQQPQWRQGVSAPPADLKTTWRRVRGNFVLLLAGCWILVLLGVSAAATSGDSGIPLINRVTALVPGFALIPGSYYAVKFRRMFIRTKRRRCGTNAPSMGSLA